MAMGLQDLIMFRDNLQQPSNTGLQNLDLLNKLTFQSMGSQEYMNQPMMMDTGLMSLPVAQAGFGGFVKSIAKGISGAVKGVAKGVTGAVKGVAGAVKNIAKSPIGQFGIPAAAMFLGPAAFGLGSLSPLAGKAILAGGATGLTSLVGGAKPEDALKRAVLAGGLTYGGGKLFGAGGAKGVESTKLPVGATGDPSSSAYFTQPTTATTPFSAGVDVAANTYGDVAGTGLAPEFGVTPEQLASPSPAMSSYGGDITTAQYPGGTAPTGQPTGILDIIKSAGSTALDRTQDALKAGFDFAKDNKALTALGGAALLSGLGGGQQIPQNQLAMAGLTPVETDFDKQIFTYKDTQGNILTRDEALRMIQQASQNVEAGGQKVASGVTYGFDRLKSGGPVDPMLSSSGGLIGMAYGGSMPMNDMDVKYKEFSGMVGGRGSGMEDNVYMPIVEGEQGQQVATLAVSPKEYVVDANTMSLLGNGNPDEGAEVMDQTVKDIRRKATGQTEQQKEIDGLAALNRMRRSV